MPLVSVIVPVYNVADCLPRMLESLRAQTLGEMEFVLVDDGSTDGSGALCDVQAAADRRFRVAHQPNGGVSAARNTGLRMAAGSLIGFADGDDWVEPTMYQRLAEALTRTGADCAMCGYFEHFPQEARPPVAHGVTSPAESGAEQALYEVLRRDGPFCSIWNKLFRREALTEADGLRPFKTDLAVGEDETWLTATLLRIQKCAYVPEALYHWGSRAESATRVQRITPGRWTAFAAKRITLGLVSPLSRRLRILAESRIVNDCYDLKVLAYRAHDREALHRVRREMRPCWGSYWRCRDVPLLRRAKVLTMQGLMALRLPSAWVDWVYDLRRAQRSAPASERSEKHG